MINGAPTIPLRRRTPGSGSWLSSPTMSGATREDRHDAPHGLTTRPLTAPGLLRFLDRRRILASGRRVQAGGAIVPRRPQGGLGAMPASWTIRSEKGGTAEPGSAA